MMELPASLVPSPTPLRRIVRSSSTRRKRAINSRKAGGQIECESDHEARFAILAELDPNVTRIYSQPFYWTHWFDGKKRHHWPDFGLMFGEQLEIHEVKPIAKLHDDVEWKTRCDWAEWCAKKGAPYSLALDIHLEEPFRLRCIHTLWFEYFRKVDPLVRIMIQSALESGPQSIGTIIESFSAPRPDFDEIIALAAQGHIYIDTSQEFTHQTIIRFPDKANPPPRLIPFHPPRRGERL